MADEARDWKAPWNRAAASYAEGFAGQVEQLFGPTLDAARVGPGTRVLDVATGPGLLAAAAVARGAEAAGTDLSDRMIDAARAAHPHLRFEVAPAEAQPFPDASFDAVVMGLALFLLPEPTGALAEARRVLVPGGRVACSLWRFPLVGHDLFYRHLGDFVEEEQPAAGHPPLLGVSDPAALRRVMTQAGFVEPALDEVDVVWELSTIDRLFDALAAMRDLSGVGTDQLREFRGRVARDAEAYRVGDVLRIPFPARVLSGRRPD